MKRWLAMFIISFALGAGAVLLGLFASASFDESDSPSPSPTATVEGTPASLCPDLTTRLLEMKCSAGIAEACTAWIACTGR